MNTESGCATAGLPSSCSNILSASSQAFWENTNNERAREAQGKKENPPKRVEPESYYSFLRASASEGMRMSMDGGDPEDGDPCTLPNGTTGIISEGKCVSGPSAIVNVTATAEEEAQSIAYQQANSMTVKYGFEKINSRWGDYYGFEPTLVKKPPMSIGARSVVIGEKAQLPCGQIGFNFGMGAGIGSGGRAIAGEVGISGMVDTNGYTSSTYASPSGGGTLGGSGSPGGSYGYGLGGYISPPGPSLVISDGLNAEATGGPSRTHVLATPILTISVSRDAKPGPSSVTYQIGGPSFGVGYFQYNTTSKPMGIAPTNIPGCL
jgi:hypothetical protein